MTKKNRKAKVDFFLLFVFSVLVVFILFVIPQYRNLRVNVGEVSCRAIRNSLSNAINQYKLENGENDFLLYKEIDIIMLKEKNYTGEKYLVCPDGGVYKINKEGQVYCTKHNPDLEDR
ncbi:MAG: hypothetical protein WC002_02385 [Candidatus Muiribacteriota bacterium]|jgi:competence protein ComGC